ncbi:MAG TPA: hypothetical protein VNM92_03230 [Thermoanaerobaculia bacterium]|nr:hypothetical protein [Thermoanaerobaculia bacterium]
MTTPPNTVLSSVATTVLRSRVDSRTDADTVVAITRRTYDDLAGVLVPLIGEVGLTALSSRALHLAMRDYPGSQVAGPSEAVDLSDQIHSWLDRQDDNLRIDAASAMISALGGLLVTFIGEPLTMRLVQKAWPEGFPDGSSLETHP